MENSNVFIDIMKENWLHARHAETERMWFTNIYAVIIVAMSSFIAQRGLENLSIASLKIIVIVLLLISVLWSLITLKLNLEFKNHIDSITRIFNDKKIKLGNEWRSYMGMPLFYSGFNYRVVFTIAFFLLSFYVLAITGLIYALVSLFQGKVPLI